MPDVSGRAMKTAERLPAVEIRRIVSRADYEAILAEIEKLWDAEQGSAEADRLENLAKLIEAYEVKHFPIFPIDLPDVLDASRRQIKEGGGLSHEEFWRRAARDR